MLEFQAHNVVTVYEEIERIDKIIDNLEDFYRGSAMRTLRNVFVELFRREGSTQRTERWHPLAPSTLRAFRRRSKRKTRKILWDTGLLRRSYVHDPLVRINKNVMHYGSIVSYAKYHETGTRYMPARPVIGYAAIIAPARLQRALNKYLRQKVNNGT